MRSIALLLNAVSFIHCERMTDEASDALIDAPVPKHKVKLHPIVIPSNSTTLKADEESSSAADLTDPASTNSPPGDFDWQQYASGDRSDWRKYMMKPDSGNGPTTSSDNSTEWNGGQGDNYGEPFRSQTGGDYRYKVGRDGNNNTSGGWEQYAAPYSAVNPSEPGSESSSSAADSSYGQSFDWKQFMSGSSSSSSSSSSLSTTAPTAGGYFELEVQGTDLNVTATFGLGQGRGSNSTESGLGGGGGQQAYVTAKEGKLFLRGNFINNFGDVVVPAQ